MNQDHNKTTDNWMRLSKAADYIGVHFTTLRRWSDNDEIPYFKTPGGRRRFRKEDLDAFLRQSQEGKQSHLTLSSAEIIHHVRPHGFHDEPLFRQIGENHRQMMRKCGRKLIGILLQYTNQRNGDEKFVREGKNLAKQYGEICHQSGLSMVETIQAFVMMRHTIIDGLCEGGMVISDSGEETWGLYQRVNSFLDIVFLAILDSFQTYSLMEPHNY